MGEDLITGVMRDKGGEDLVTVAASATVSQATRVMAEHDIGAVVVMSEEGLPDGIFTERDVLRRVVDAGRDPTATPVSLVMTRDVRFVPPGTSIDAALALMYVLRCRHLLVIDGPHVHGMVSMRDLVYAMVRREGAFDEALQKAGGTGR